MGQWSSYTVYPADGVPLTELQELLGDELDDPRIEGIPDDPQWVPPIITDNLWTVPQSVEQGGAIGLRLPSEGDLLIFEDAIVNWLERCAESIEIAFIFNYNDISEAGTLSAYRIEDGWFQEIQSEMVRYEHDSDRGSWPEGGARLHPHDPLSDETDHTVDYLVEFEAEFGYRPMTFYG